MAQILTRAVLKSGTIERGSLPQIRRCCKMSLIAAAVLVGLLQTSAAPKALAEPATFTVGWSVYAGWNPYFYMQKSGILKKWADKYGIKIKVQRFDYAASLDSFVAKNIDACTMTNMEALDMPAASGVDSTVIITGDYSNGNDAVLTRNGLTFDKLAGHRVMLVQKTVSEYLLERGMVMSGQQAKLGSLKLLNTSDSDIAPAFLNNASNEAVVTWKPLVSQILVDKGVHSIFDSSQIPGEILDLLVVRTEVLKRPDGSGEKFAKAMNGAWYETMQRLTGNGAPQAEALKVSAAASGDSVDSYKSQLKTTALFSTPKAAADFTTSPTLKQKMDLVRQFCFAHGLLGKSTKSVDDVAIAYPDGSVQGKKDRVKLRFDAGYMQAAQQGKL
ncbi:putative urea ABC transporter substrate-binding protein [Granulicella tundricola]|uniref:ABC transporter periplasmic binding protein, urea carboxylase region n=1 Tax=Granulicella tundricola (strain ATCC BAA-1859 / DSM 23138 / MP5ACTX9) TaxID=1198114 RepID=E8X3S7_GRATM|nr:putative urea ABC transporter substrate-binding protein [Granulicella tundricola]ADW69355.1 ABC transporter periplasmic binding protein, urea carboxylase region [Granulicella tundricola MP5ACTX9]